MSESASRAENQVSHPMRNNVVSHSNPGHADPSATMEQHYLRSLQALRSILRRNLPSSTSSSPVVQAHLQQQTGHYSLNCVQSRTFRATAYLWADDHAASSGDPSRKGRNSQDVDAADALAQGRGKQIRTPWHRDESSLPPVARQESAGAMKKGADFFTPSI